MKKKSQQQRRTNRLKADIHGRADVFILPYNTRISHNYDYYYILDVWCMAMGELNWTREKKEPMWRANTEPNTTCK